MGIPDRKEREKQELRDLILKEARALFLEEGFEKTSLRKIAERIEYSPTTIYLYFKDKNELFLALHEESFQRFFSALSSVASVPDPFERLTALGRAYIEYGINNPEEYDLKFLLKAPLETLSFDMKYGVMGSKLLNSSSLWYRIAKITVISSLISVWKRLLLCYGPRFTDWSHFTCATGSKCLRIRISSASSKNLTTLLLNFKML